MSSGRWSDAELERWRGSGDPLADAAVSQVFAAGDLPAVQTLMNTLVLNDGMPPSELPPELRNYLDETDRIPAPALADTKAGERLFGELGPEILMLLACYSLPQTYAARKGVQVLYRTGFLVRRPNRRLFETTQMVVDVLSPGGLAPTGQGVRAVQKVRLMHAAIRRLILEDKENTWDVEQLGVPINQEDMAGTLMSFSWLVLDGLEKLGIHVREEEKQTYLDVWLAVGLVLGIQPELLPANMEEAGELTALILQQQVHPSEQGRVLTGALLEMMDEFCPPLCKGFPAALMRHFLPGQVADGLGIPQGRLDERLAVAALHFAGDADERIDRTAWGRALRHFNVSLVQGMINVDRGGKRTRFSIPDNLQKDWDLAPIEEKGLGARLRGWMRL